MKPLEGMRILTVEQFGAGPYGSMFLADLGAEVIKIENAETGGDAARHVGPHRLGPGQGQYYQTWNMNKLSVALDLKSTAGRADFERLAATADAVIDNLRGDQPAKLGLDYASLKHCNARIVCLHISAYGRDNERRAWPGYDYLMQAEAGIMALTGEPEGAPSRIGCSMIDYMSGLTGVVGLLACISRARQTGIGCDVDTSLFDVALHQLGYSAIWYLNERDVSRRQPRSAHLAVAPVQTFPTADGWIFIMCMTDKFWSNLVEALGRPELKGDPRFDTPDKRQQNRAVLGDLLDAELRRQSTRHWLKRLSGLLPVAPVYEVDEALDSAFVHATGMVRDLPHPLRADFRVLANPLKIDGVRPEQVPAHDLGADTARILASLPATKAPA
ncbi:MAG TPA: CoA transferase [Candidatus Sulfotelmatobacter sp.]|nr:CoA transferase [Candidatus Sulfotelmatobacter sp.]